MLRPTTARTVTLILSAILAGPAAGCSGGESTSPPTAATITATAGTGLSAVVGTAVSASPTVRVSDAGGAPVAGVAVQFSVTAGGGALERSTATTDAAGSASAGRWTLGTVTGVNTVEASVTGLPAARFTATGTAGAAASLTVSAGENQTAAVGTALSTAPAVLVRDQYANPVAGVAVAFAVETGGGTLTGATTTSGADGIARLGAWALGIASGAQRIRAASGSLSATITATAIVPAGCTPINYVLGATLPMNWETDDCTSATSGRRYDRLQFTTTQQQEIVAEVTGPSGRSLLLRKGELYVGLQPGTTFSPPTQNPMRFKYVLAPGTYVFEPYAPDASTTGAYTFTTGTGTKIDCDYIVFASTNVTMSGVVDDTSCLGPFGGREQWINLQLETGMKVRLTLSNTDAVPMLVFRDDRLGPASPTLAVAEGATAGETLVVNWTATFDTWHEVIVTSRNGALGKYTLKIEELP